MKSSEKHTKTIIQPPLMAAALVGEQPGSLLPHQQHQGDGSTSCLSLWIKLQQHQLYAVSSDSEHRQQPGYCKNGSSCRFLHGGGPCESECLKIGILNSSESDNKDNAYFLDEHKVFKFNPLRNGDEKLLKK
uniref:C3H1-type domain-containing protein n=1 Tax=Solanum lycopersicum TaxID=4081 RepID=A0A3Q7I2H7_SOLLC